MTSLLSRTFVLVIVFGLSIEHLSFSFRSHHDGYIYPSWKKNEMIDEYLYEDAVVVGNQSIVLCGGVEGTKGPNGIVSHYQCIRLAEKLDKFVQDRQCAYIEKFFKVSLKSYSKLGLLKFKDDLSDVATTLLYIKLEGNRLYSGLSGNSGYIIFRYNQFFKTLRMYQNIDGNKCGDDKLCKLTQKSINVPENYVTKVEEGDVVMAYSDGLGRILPPSFLTALTNFLVGMMIQRKREKDQGKIYNYDYDYDYDLADLVEGYLQNLHVLSLHLKNKLIEKLYQSVKDDKTYFNKMKINPIDKSLLLGLKKQEEIDREYIKHLSNYFFTEDQNKDKLEKNQGKQDPISKNYRKYQKNVLILKESIENSFKKEKNNNIKDLSFINQQQIDSINANKQSIINNKHDSNKIEPKVIELDDLENDDLEPDFFIKNQSENSKKFDELMKDLKIQTRSDAEIAQETMKVFHNEICNLLDPTDERLSLKLLEKSRNLKDQTLHNAKHDLKRAYEPVDCFKNRKINKRINRHPLKNNWKCTDIARLSFSTGWSSIRHYDFDTCVYEALPDLPENTTVQEIAEAFNSQYFSRSTDIAAKIVAEDPRFIFDHYFLKHFFNKDTFELQFSLEKMENFRFNYRSKDRDISVAGTVIGKHDKIDQIKEGEKDFPHFESKLIYYNMALESMFKYIRNQEIPYKII